MSWFTPVSGGGGGGDLNDIATDATTGSIIFADADGLGEDNANLFWDDTNNRIGIHTDAPTATFHIQANSDTVMEQVSYWDYDTRSNLTASTEFTPYRFDFGQLTWSTGLIVNQRFFYLDAPDIRHSGASTVTNAATLYVQGAPSFTSNTTVTNQMALWIDDGQTRMDGSLQVTSGPYSLGNDTIPSWGALTAEFIGASISGVQMSIAEHSEVLMNFGQTKEFASGGGTVAAQRVVRILAPTYTALTDAVTLTTASTLYIDAAPTASTNITITNAYALEIGAGHIKLGIGQRLLLDDDGHSYIFSNADDSVLIYTGTTASMGWTLTQIIAYRNINPDNDAGDQTIGTTNRHWGHIYTTGNIYLDADNDTSIGSDTANTIQLLAGNTEVVEFDVAEVTFQNTLGIAYTQAAGTSGSPSALTITGGAHTTLAASTEAVDVNFDIRRTIQWATGAISEQRAFVIEQPTYAFVGASTITTAATFVVEGEPAAGTNATITDSWSILSKGPIEILDVTGTGSSTKNGLHVTSAGVVVGNKSDSPMISVVGTSNVSGDVGGDAQFHGYGWQSVPTSSGTTTSVLALYNQKATAITSGGWGTSIFEISQSGEITLGIATSGTPREALHVLEAAHTTLTASTESISVEFDLSATVEFATGALATQRAMRIQAPTYAFAGASTLTDSATLYINAAPAAGANATITRSYSLWIDAGHLRYDLAIALGGGASATLGTIGGSGPAAAAQNEWIEIYVGTNKRWIPVWA